MDDLSGSLAATLTAARSARGLTVAGFADLSGVSRAMISKIERGEAQPTAALLGKLSAALGMTLSELIARAEGQSGRLVRRAEQPIWIDPESGYSRRAVSPASRTDLELIEVALPPGARIAYPAEAYLFLEQQIWVLEGRLHFAEGEQTHILDAGDCLELGSPTDCAFINPSSTACRYLVALHKVPGGRRRTA